MESDSDAESAMSDVNVLQSTGIIIEESMDEDGSDYHPSESESGSEEIDVEAVGAAVVEE